MSGEAPAAPLPPHEPVPSLAACGVTAFTTTRAAGSYGLAGGEPVGEVMARWSALLAGARAAGVPRLVSSGQVHGAAIAEHGDGFAGWLRGHGLDGHWTTSPGTALAVTIADCTPVFVAARTSSAVMLLHAGWRGTASRILEEGIQRLAHRGVPARDLVIHLGPAICGRCYEVGPEVFAALGLPVPPVPALLDLRAVLAERAHRAGVPDVSVDGACTRCGDGRGVRPGPVPPATSPDPMASRPFFSHRAGEHGRQLAVCWRGRVPLA